MPPASRGHNVFSLGIAPLLMGLGHLAPSLGAIRTATGSYRVPLDVLGMIGTAAALVDAVDTYKDIPESLRPRKVFFEAWKYLLWAIILITTYSCGFDVAITMWQFSSVGLLWGTPCFPAYSRSAGLKLWKPKAILMCGKSLVSAGCLGCITAGTCMFYYCHDDETACSAQSLRNRCLGLAVLYEFFRENACDIRDIAEDLRDGMSTLPILLGGKKNTLLLMTCIGVLLDAILTFGVDVSNAMRLQLDLVRIVESLVRVGLLMLMYWKILEYPRRHELAWGIMSLCGLLPVLWAQAALTASGDG